MRLEQAGQVRRLPAEVERVWTALEEGLAGHDAAEREQPLRLLGRVEGNLCPGNAART